MSRAWRVAARPSERLQAKPRRPAAVRALLTRQPTATRRARAPERRRAPAHGCAAETLSGSEIDGTEGTDVTAGSGSGSWAAAVAGTANSAAMAAPSAA